MIFIDVLIHFQQLKYMSDTVNAKLGNSGTCQWQVFGNLFAHVSTYFPGLRNCINFNIYRQYFSFPPITTSVITGYFNFTNKLISFYPCNLQYNGFIPSTVNKTISCYNSVMIASWPYQLVYKFYDFF
jgi:hypothetical protein